MRRRRRAVYHDADQGRLRLVTANPGEDHAINGTAALVTIQFQVKNNAPSGATALSVVTAMEAALAAAQLVASNGSACSSQVALATTDLQAALTEFRSYRMTATTGDVTGDGNISIGDLGLIAKHYGKTSASTGWTAIQSLDVNRDGSIGLEDLILVSSRMMQTNG